MKCRVREEVKVRRQKTMIEIEKQRKRNKKVMCVTSPQKRKPVYSLWRKVWEYCSMQGMSLGSTALER